LPSNLKNHPDLSGFHNFAFYLFTFFPTSKTPKQLTKVLIGIATASPVPINRDERVAVKMTFELLLLPPKCEFIPSFRGENVLTYSGRACVMLYVSHPASGINSKNFFLIFLQNLV